MTRVDMFYTPLYMLYFESYHASLCAGRWDVQQSWASEHNKAFLKNVIKPFVKAHLEIKLSASKAMSEEEKKNIRVAVDEYTDKNSLNAYTRKRSSYLRSFGGCVCMNCLVAARIVSRPHSCLTNDITCTEKRARPRVPARPRVNWTARKNS